MKQILVVLTGGTIGSRAEGKIVDVTGTSPYRLISLYRETYGCGEEFEVVQPFAILSENMDLTAWTCLCRTMWDIAYEDYAGVIVAHGSDTLSYTSALLGMALRHVPVPVVLIASNYPLGEKGSNGLINFKSAVELIRAERLRGVFAVYQNNREENVVYLATRLTEADPYLDQFGSFGGVPFGKMEGGELVLCEDRRNPSLKQIVKERDRIAGHSPCFLKNVLVIRPYPGLDYRTVDLTTKPAAVLHYLYHSATACTKGEGSSVLSFLERCRAMEIPVYTASSKNAAGRNYITAKEMTDMGAVPMENISLEAAYAKLLLWYNLKETGVEAQIGQEIFFENPCV